MMILRILFYAFLIYLAYRLIFDFILPVYRTTRQVRRGFREMHERMQQHTSPSQHEEPTPQRENGKGSVGEYIDFEEIKD